jgi:hypothetical protein
LTFLSYLDNKCHSISYPIEKDDSIFYPICSKLILFNSKTTQNQNCYLASFLIDRIWIFSFKLLKYFHC